MSMIGGWLSAGNPRWPPWKGSHHLTWKTKSLITMYDGSISQISDHYKPFFRFRDIIHVNSYDTKMMMVNAGLGFGMIPRFYPSPEV